MFRTVADARAAAADDYDQVERRLSPADFAFLIPTSQATDAVRFAGFSEEILTHEKSWSYFPFKDPLGTQLTLRDFIGAVGRPRADEQRAMAGELHEGDGGGDPQEGRRLHEASRSSADGPYIPGTGTPRSR